MNRGDLAVVQNQTEAQACEGQMTSRIPDWFLSVFALPVGMVWWAAKYADTREG
jgi:hypothetical protein